MLMMMNNNGQQQQQHQLWWGFQTQPGQSSNNSNSSNNALYMMMPKDPSSSSSSSSPSPSSSLSLSSNLFGDAAAVGATMSNVYGGHRGLQQQQQQSIMMGNTNTNTVGNVSNPFAPAGNATGSHLFASLLSQTSHPQTQMPQQHQQQQQQQQAQQNLFQFNAQSQSHPQQQRTHQQQQVQKQQSGFVPPPYQQEQESGDSIKIDLNEWGIGQNQNVVGKALALCREKLTKHMQYYLSDNGPMSSVDLAAAKRAMLDHQNVILRSQKKGSAGTLSLDHWDISAICSFLKSSPPYFCERDQAATFKGLINEVHRTRHMWAHQDSLSLDDIFRFLDSVEKLFHDLNFIYSAKEVQMVKHTNYFYSFNKAYDLFSLAPDSTINDIFAFVNKVNDNVASSVSSSATSPSSQPSISANTYRDSSPIIIDDSIPMDEDIINVDQYPSDDQSNKMKKKKRRMEPQSNSSSINSDFNLSTHMNNYVTSNTTNTGAANKENKFALSQQPAQIKHIVPPPSKTKGKKKKNKAAKNLSNMSSISEHNSLA